MKFTLIFVFLLSVFFKAYSKDSTSVIHVGYYIKALKMNNKDENADIDFYYWYHFKLPKDTSDMKSIYNLEFVNGDISSNEIQEERIIGNEYYLTGRIKGTFCNLSWRN